MAEPYDRRPDTPERYEDTRDPRNPPNSVANSHVRSTALRSYLGPLLAFFIIVGLALIYWANRGPAVGDVDERAEIGTTGDRQDTVGERGNRTDTPGGFNPDPQPGSTRDEVEFRGGNEPATELPGLTSETTLTNLRAMADSDGKTLIGKRIDVDDVKVVRAEDATRFWVEDGSTRVAVVAPSGGPSVSVGSTVTVSGIVEPDGQGGTRIRATRVTTD
jgi:hypothetical protein